MSMRYLFGPVSNDFADDNLAAARAAGDCCAFSFTAGGDLLVQPDDTWQSFQARFPAGWQPDFIALYLPYRTIPAWLWSAPVPLVGLAGDWNWLWHCYRLQLQRCELVLCDTAGVERLRREGFEHVQAWNMYGAPAGLAAAAWPERERDIDVLFVGNFNPAMQGERLGWLGRVAGEGRGVRGEGRERRWRVVLAGDVYGEDYRELLGRARIVFNRSVRGEWNQRVGEALAAGALLFQEAENREVAAALRGQGPGARGQQAECVYYTDENLEELLDYYLEHEDERRAIAEAGRARLAEFTFERLWGEAVERIEGELPELRARARGRPALDTVAELKMRTWQAFNTTVTLDAALVGDLERELEAAPRSAVLRHALGAALAWSAERRAPSAESAPRSTLRAPLSSAATAMQQAWMGDPGNVLAGLNLAEILAGMGQKKEAVEQCERTLAMIERIGELSLAMLDGPHYPNAYDDFRVNWERAAWTHAGNPRGEAEAKRGLLRWRLHQVLGALTGDAVHLAEAALVRPDLPASHAMLGHALARQGRWREAAVHLRRTLDLQPFDRDAARALYGVLGQCGERVRQERLAAEYRAISRAAPGIVPAEPWFCKDKEMVATGAMGAMLSRRVVVESEAGGDTAKACGQTAGEASPACFRGDVPDSTGHANDPRKHGTHIIHGNHGTPNDDCPTLRVVWEGGFAAVHSLALVNREICGRLAKRGHEVRLEPTETVGSESRVFPVGPELTGLFHKGLSGPADVHVVHQWPPGLTRSAEGRWVIMQPWEFGSLPKAWIGPMNQADEVWVPSGWVRDCFVKSGVNGERVHVIPLGVGDFGLGIAECGLAIDDCANPQAAIRNLQFRFLFVGGTIHRKGIDLLLRAYESTFCDKDDVCLVIKDMGVGSFYRGQTAEKLLADFRSRPHAPAIEYVDRELTAEEMAGLYASCDCLVHPFRGEGFGLPIVEAMAHGLPAIITGYGPVLDYSSDETAYLLPAREARFASKKIDGEETVDYPWLVEPDLDTLRYLLRHVYEHPEEARRKGEAARGHILRHFTWEHTVAAVEARLRELAVHCRTDCLSVLPAPADGLTIRPTRGQRVSLCMIVKNEEACLETCLRSAADLVDEMVIVDTGSTDRTREIASHLGAKVIDFVWQDSFAAARNESIRHATGDWILWLDADERLDETNRERLRALFDRLGEENTAYLMRQHSPLEGGGDRAAAVDQVRLFRNLPGLRWQHRVHEQILPSLRSLGADVRPTDIVIDHAGFGDPRTQDPKVERNLRLLRLELAEQPDDAFVLFNLGAVLLTQGRHDEAVDFLSRSLKHSRPGDTVLPKIYALLVRGRHERGNKEEAMRICREGRQAVPGDAELLFWEAILRHETGNLDGAAEALSAILNAPKGHHFMGFDAGLCGYRTRNFLAEIYYQQGKLGAAETQWSAAVADCHSFIPAWKKLGELWLRQQRWQDVEKAVRALHEHPDMAAEATVLWCKALLAQKDLDNARKLLERVLAKNPGHAEAAQTLHLVLQQRDDIQDQPDVVIRASERRPRVSLSMIVKNEEANLRACLESVADLVDEIVIADTGSTDRSKEIAAEFGARVIDFAWVDSFAAARNASLAHTTGDWVFWMDADDRLDAANREKFRRLRDNLPGAHAGYVMKCLCLPDAETGRSTVVDHVRLFRKNPGMAWKYRVHEQILAAIRKNGGSLGWTEIVVHHCGYRDANVRRRKLERDLRLLLLEQSEQPDDPFTLFNLGSVYQEMGKLEEALPLFRRSLDRSYPTDSIVRKLYALIAQCQNNLGRFADAGAVCREGKKHYPDDPEMLFQEGIAYRHLGDIAGAVRSWERVLQSRPGPHFASMHTGLCGYLTRHNLATAYLDSGQPDKAKAHWRATLSDFPDDVPALAGLGELALKEQNWDELAEVLGQLEKRPGGTAEAHVLRARMHLARKEFATARAVLATAIATQHDAIRAHVVLSHVLLQEGRDWAAAEQALRDVLALDPEHAEARHNLEVLLRRRQPE